MKEEVITIDNNELAFSLLGQKDENLETIEKQLSVQIIARGNKLKIIGEEDNVEKVVELIKELIKVLRKNKHLTLREIQYAAQLARAGRTLDLKSIYNDVIQVTFRGKQIKPKTLGQKAYVDAIRNNDIVFGIGPAGTGKTYLAMVMAVRSLISKKISRIILTRPAIEAGEKLGFLPGDLQDKVDPYLRPLYDALYDILGVDKVHELMDRDIIEVAPLAYMRGRTLDDSFVILDEAQNTTGEQMKMFLTRLGSRSQAVITGDITQVDLPNNERSGLFQVQKILKGINGIEFVYLTNKDVVRHRLVQEIISAYDKYENKK